MHYLCHFKSNNIIGQRKTTNKEKHFYPRLNLTHGRNTSRKHARISIFKNPKSKSGTEEHNKEKKNI